MNIRWMERDGKLILQAMKHDHTWQDIPIYKEPEAQNKPNEYWLKYPKDPMGVKTFQCTPPDADKRDHYIHVTEVPKGYKLISRDEALAAFDEMWTYHRNLNYHEKMKACLKELGSFDE